jgi:hypothetical protein
MTCNQCYWLDSNPRSSQKLESHKKDSYLFSYEFCKLADLDKKLDDFPEKTLKRARSDRTRATHRRAGPMRTALGRENGWPR